MGTVMLRAMKKPSPTVIKRAANIACIMIILAWL